MERTLKVLMLNGSPRKNGNIALAFSEMEQVFRENGVEVENILLGNKDIRGCIACETCRKNRKCVFDDIVNELAVKCITAPPTAPSCPPCSGCSTAPPSTKP